MGLAMDDTQRAAMQWQDGGEVSSGFRFALAWLQSGKMTTDSSNCKLPLLSDTARPKPRPSPQAICPRAARGQYLAQAQSPSLVGFTAESGRGVVVERTRNSVDYKAKDFQVLLAPVHSYDSSIFSLGTLRYNL